MFTCVLIAMLVRVHVACIHTASAIAVEVHTDTQAHVHTGSHLWKEVKGELLLPVGQVCSECVYYVFMATDSHKGVGCSQTSSNSKHALEPANENTLSQLLPSWHTNL